MTEDSPQDQPLTRRRQRLLSAVDEIPQPVPTNRARSESEAASRHLDALRRRLDRLVEREDKLGDDQRDLHSNRAERNALIFALTQLAPEAERLAPAPARTAAPRAHSPEHLREVEARIEEAIEAGFTVTDPRRPGVLGHRSGDDIAALQVPLPVWFGVRHFVRGQEQA